MIQKAWLLYVCKIATRGLEIQFYQRKQVLSSRLGLRVVPVHFIVSHDEIL